MLRRVFTESQYKGFATARRLTRLDDNDV